MLQSYCVHLCIGRSLIPVMNNFPFAYFPFFFIGGWIAVTFIISRLGWSKLAYEYKTDPELFTGNKIGLISARINFTNYNNCLSLAYNDQGLLFKLIFLFRLFHPPILI